MFNLGRIRTSLTTNKIFFETVAVFLLSTMAIIVAVTQTWIATKQTHLMELQTRVAEVQVLPQFQILSFASNDGHASWEVRNEGAPIHDFVFEAGCFLTLTVTTNDMTRKTVQLPVTDCLGSWNASGGGEGIVARVGGMANTKEVAAALYRIRSAAAARDWDNVVSRIELLAHLRYRDVLDRPHDDYFASGTFSDTRSVEASEGIALMKKWSSPEGLRIADLDPERAFALLAAER